MTLYGRLTSHFSRILPEVCISSGTKRESLEQLARRRCSWLLKGLQISIVPQYRAMSAVTWGKTWVPDDSEGKTKSLWCAAQARLRAAGAGMLLIKLCRRALLHGPWLPYSRSPGKH